jgi:hypothetical protein
MNSSTTTTTSSRGSRVVIVTIITITVIIVVVHVSILARGRKDVSTAVHDRVEHGEVVPYATKRSERGSGQHEPTTVG